MVNRSGRKTVLLVLLVFGLVFALGGVSLAAIKYVNPGDDAADINTVISGTVAGDTIIFNDGTYNLTGTIEVDVDNLTLRSETTGGAKIYPTSALNVIEVYDNRGITVDGLHFEAVGNSAECIYFHGGSPASSVTITNSTFVGFVDEEAIEASSWESMTYDFTVTNNTFRDCDGAIYAEDFEACTVDISGNTFENIYDYAIEIGDLGENNSVMDIRVTGNTITADEGTDCYAGIYIGNVEGTTHISNNTIKGDLDYGISVSAFGLQGASRVSAFIEKNEIRVDGTGMDLGDLFGSIPGDLIVRYNTIETNAPDDEVSGIYVDTFNDADSTATFRDNNIIGDSSVASWGFSTMATVLIDAQGNWWGDASGPYDNKTLPGTPNYDNPEGQGKKVTSYIDYANWRTTAWEEEDDSSSGCSAVILNPLFLLLLAPLGLLLRKPR